MSTSECIYCLRSLPLAAFTKEHVLPQAFGTYENNLTLTQSVCCDCNQFFGDHLESVLAEGSFEAVRRLDYGIRSPEAARYLRRDRVSFSLSGGKWDGLAMSLQGDNTDLFVSPVPQVRFAKKDDSGWVHVTEQELESTESLPQEINTKQMILLYDSQETKKRLIQALSRLGVDFQEEEGGFLSRDNVRDGWVVVETQIDEVILRCMAKIAFNYLAKTAGDEFVKKSDFDSIRSFIREGIRPKHDFVGISSYPILAYDSLTYRQTNGHLVTGLTQLND